MTGHGPPAPHSVELNRADREKLTAARLWLISAPGASSPPGDDAPRGQAYLAHALFALHPVSSVRVTAIAVDESWRVYVNPAWLASATVVEVGRQLAHLVWHLLNDHAVRARSVGVTAATAQRWLRCTDNSLTDLLRPAGLRPHDMPASPYPPGMTPSPEEQFAEPRGNRSGDDRSRSRATGSADGLDDSCGSGADGLRRDYEQSGTVDLPEVTPIQADLIRREVGKAVLSSGGHPGHAGAADGALARWAEQLLTPVVPWPQILGAVVRRAVATAAGRGDYSYRRPSRRASVTPGIVMPSPYAPVPQVAVAVDTSASMSERQLGRAVAELDSIVLSLGLGENGIIAISADTTAYVRRVRRAADIALLGGGGTDMSVAIAAAAAQRPRPEVCIVLTDGCTPWPSAPVPGMPVVAVILGEGLRPELPATPAWMLRVEVVDAP